MYKKVNILHMSVIFATLIGCGSGGSNPVDAINTLQDLDKIAEELDDGLADIDGFTDGLNELPSTFDSINLNSTEYAEFTGVWDVSDASGLDVDELYLVIDANGVFRQYDYMGDTFDQGPNCYLVELGWIEKSGGLYDLHYESGELVPNISMQVSGDTLSIANSAEGFTADYPRDSRTEEEYSPSCDTVAPKPYTPTLWL